MLWHMRSALFECAQISLTLLDALTHRALSISLVIKKKDALITDLHKTDVFNPFSEKSKRTIHNLGKIELFELGEVSASTRCPSCAKYWTEGSLYCICGQCFLPSEKQKRMTTEKCDALSIPSCVMKMGQSRGAEHGKSQDHFKAHESLRHAKKKGYSSILERFQKEDSYRTSHTSIFWTEEKCACTSAHLHWKTNRTRPRKLSVNAGPNVHERRLPTSCDEN